MYNYDIKLIKSSCFNLITYEYICTHPLMQILLYVLLREHSCCLHYPSP